MAKVNISQAARLVGKSRTTIHRKINKGELSIQGGLIDTSELIRTFGELVTPSEQNSTPEPRSKVVTSEHVTVQQQVQLEVLQAKYDSLQRELALKDELNESLREQIRLLEHQPSTSETPAPNMSEKSDSNMSENYDFREKRKKEGRLVKLGRFIFDA